MKALLAIGLLCCFPALCAAQTFDDTLATLIDDVLIPRVAGPEPALRQADTPAREFSAAGFFLTQIITFYQVTISSQDMTVCNYYPSCSHFSQEALVEAGMLRGLLLTSDRLQRCNGLVIDASAYQYDTRRGKLLDPIGRYTKTRGACCTEH